MNKDTKSNHPSPSEDSLLRDLKKEIIKLKSLNRRAAEEIRYLDDMIIKSIEDNEVIEYLDIDDAYFAGFSSINLLNRLDGKTSGGYIENYPDLHIEMKTLDGHYQIEHPDFYSTEYLNKDKHPPECKWHKDWHACDCGEFDKREEAMKDFKCPECGDLEFRCHHDEDYLK